MLTPQKIRLDVSAGICFGTFLSTDAAHCNLVKLIEGFFQTINNYKRRYISYFFGQLGKNLAKAV
jgi:hypothetical protein